MIDSGNWVPARKRITIIQNPASGGVPGLLEKTLSSLKSLGVEVQVLTTQKAGDGRELARRISAQQDLDALVVAGGDGTCNEVAHGLLGRDLPMGTVPVGTANVLATEIGMGRTPESIAHTLAFGETRSICLGQMNDRIFLLMAGSGWDARVVAGVSSRLKKLLGRWAYAVQAAREVLKTPASSLRITLGNKTVEGDWVIVCNAGHYGGRYLIAPKACLETPSFQVMIFNGRQGPVGRIKDLVALWLGRPGFSRNIRVYETDRVHIACDSPELIQIDGDPAGSLPAEISLAPKRLHLIVPTPT